jgi:hypothetical protein
MRGAEIPWVVPLPETRPNTALHLTAYSVRSYVAPASGSR